MLRRSRQLKNNGSRDFLKSGVVVYISIDVMYYEQVPNDCIHFSRISRATSRTFIVLIKNFPWQFSVTAVTQIS